MPEVKVEGSIQASDVMDDLKQQACAVACRMTVEEHGKFMSQISDALTALNSVISSARDDLQDRGG